MSRKSGKASDLYQKLTARNFGVYSLDDQEKLNMTHICIVGLGCIGGMVTLLLARIGIGKLTLIDGDKYELPNINRQPMAFRSTLNLSKVEVARKQLIDINPQIALICHTEHLTTKNATNVIGDSTIVIQCIDDMKTRCLLHRYCKSKGLVSITMSGQPPYRSIVSTIGADGPSYEELFNLDGISKMSDEEVMQADKLFKNFKLERAKYASEHGSDNDWLKEFEAGKSGWAVTPERTYIAAVLQVHECIRSILNRPVLALAPKAIIIDLSDPPNIVRVGSPDSTEKCAINGRWNYKLF
jgi:hypothetical protein